MIRTTIKIETTLFPPIEVDIGEQFQGEASPLTKFLKPRVTVAANGVALYTAQPYGRPEESPPWGLLLGLGALTLVALWATS